MKAKKANNVAPKVYCLHFNECDPSKCTALKLSRLHLIKIIKKVKGAHEKAIVLNPFAQKVISKDDRDIIKRFGIIVVDCSWAKLLKFRDLRNLNNRRLPSLIAANPVNYGKWEKLSSVEALASSLFLTGFNDYALEILSKFNWGKEFLRLNESRLIKKEKNKNE